MEVVVHDQLFLIVHLAWLPVLFVIWCVFKQFKEMDIYLWAIL